MTTPDSCELLCLDLRKAEAVRAARVDSESLGTAAERARALGDPTRLQVALALREGGDLCVCDLAWVCERSDKLVSHRARPARGGHRRLASRGQDGHVLPHRIRERAPRGGPAGQGPRMSTLAPTTSRLADAERLDLARRARVLSWASLAYMSLEGGIALLAGLMAGSVALIGFGLDSAIEGFASAIIVWRFTGHRVFSEAAEVRAQKLVAIQFFVLAPYVGYESVAALVTGDRPGVSWVGVGLAASSVVVMPFLGIAKERLADRLGSAATKGEGRQNMLCAYLAGALLFGLLGNAVFGAWWLDPVVGLLIAAVAVKEGRETWRGEGCCVDDPLSRPAPDDDGCGDGCGVADEQRGGGGWLA